LGTTGKGKVKRRIQEGRQLGQNFWHDKKTLKPLNMVQSP
jgi:hypothetical protein